MRSVEVEFTVAPSRLAFLRFVLEGFGHMALPVTLSGKQGRVKLLVSPGEEDRWEKIFRDLEPWLR